MKFWLNAAFCEPDQLLDVARAAESSGYAGVLVADHLFLPQQVRTRYPYAADGKAPFPPRSPWPDAWATIAAMAAATERIRFATAVYILPLRHPLDVAKAVGTAAVLSGNRVILGAGAGWLKEEFDAQGVDFATRGRRFDESIAVLRKLWNDGTASHHGEFFDFDPLEMHPAPDVPVPIYIGGVSPAAMRRAARLGDGWLPLGQSPDDLLAALERIHRERKEVGRSDRPFDVIAALRLLEGDARSQLEEAGVTGASSTPFPWTSLGPFSTIEQKRDFMKRFADDVIAKWS